MWWNAAGARPMIYRMRIYEGVRPNVAVFNSFFEQYLLPVQVRHGARLVGRWQTEDDRIVAVWEYDSREYYEQAQAAVRRDPDSVKAQEFRRTLPNLYRTMQETFMESTVT
jgi:hypothetical protein